MNFASKKGTQELDATQNGTNPSDSPLKNKKNMAAEYHISVKTLSRWLKKADLDIPRGLIRPCEQALIHKMIMEQRRVSANVSTRPQIFNN
jgi:hypothetical protein